MTRTFSWLRNFIGGLKQKTAGEIENADRVIVDSSPLHCPICLLIFSSTPIILPCGHSFCQSCIRRIINLSHQPDVYSATYECALCRKVCRSDARLIKNYVVDALLQSIYEIALEASEDVNIRFSLERSIIELNDCKAKISELERTVQEERTRRELHFQVNVLLVLLLVIIVFYCIKIFIKTSC